MFSLHENKPTEISLLGLFFLGGGGLTVSFEQFYICDFRARNPCPNACAAPYGFKNQMSLTKDAKRFSVSICIGYLRKDQIV